MKANGKAIAENGCLTLVSDDARTMQIQYVSLQEIGRGHSGIVYQAVPATKFSIAIPVKVAIKCFDKEQDVDWTKCERELLILRELDHQNIIMLLSYGYDRHPAEINLCLILELMPSDLRRIIQLYSASDQQRVPFVLIKVYMFQIFRALSYIHSLDICHRSVKPENILVDSETAVVKLCDFGGSVRAEADPISAYAAKVFRGHPGTLAYQAPEITLTAENTFSIDMWSAGCVMAELLLLKPIFVSRSTLDLRDSVTRALGAPSPYEFAQMVRDDDGGFGYFINYTSSNSAAARECLSTLPLEQRDNTAPATGLPAANTDGFDHTCYLLNELLRYAPDDRSLPLEACADEFFDELRRSPTKLPNGKPLPPLFNFTRQECSAYPGLEYSLAANHVVVTMRAARVSRRQQLGLRRRDFYDAVSRRVEGEKIVDAAGILPDKRIENWILSLDVSA